MLQCSTCHSSKPLISQRMHSFPIGLLGAALQHTSLLEKGAGRESPFPVTYRLQGNYHCIWAGEELGEQNACFVFVTVMISRHQSTSLVAPLTILGDQCLPLTTWWFMQNACNMTKLWKAHQFLLHWFASRNSQMHKFKTPFWIVRSGPGKSDYRSVLQHVAYSFMYFPP